MSHSRSQISLRLLKTLEDIEDQDAEGNKTLSHSLKSEGLKDDEEEPNDVVRNYTSHLASSSSQKFKEHHRDSTGKRASLRSISFRHVHEDEKETSNTDFKNGTLVKDQQSENSFELPDYNFENYDDGLSIVTQQLKSIQETQDVILAELRMDIEQLNADNLTLRLSNENLVKQVENLKRIINDLTKSKNHLQENTDDDIEIMDGNPHSAKSSHLVILNSDTEISPTPPQEDRERGMERNHSSHETSHHIPRSASEMSSRRRKSGKSRKKRKTHSKERKKEHVPRDNYHRSKHASRKNRNDSKTNRSSPTKTKSKRRCFEFMRRRKRKFELNNNNNNYSNEIENDSYVQQDVQ